jgi:hypothetical protein
MAKKRNTRRKKSGSGKRANSHVFDDVLSLAGSLLSSRKDWVADKVSHLSTATQTYADALNGIPGVAPYANLTAQTLEDFAEYINETDFNDMIRDGSIFAKRHPVQALAGAVIAGIIVSQIYRSDYKSR